MWITTRFASPYFAVNSLFLIGWITTGIVTFYLARKLQLPVYIALSCGLIVQTLPWFREKLTAHTSFVFISIPLLAVYLCLNLLESRSKRDVLFIGALLVNSAFFDMYLFYISLASVLFIIFVSFVDIKNVLEIFKKHAVATLASIFGLTAVYFLIIEFILPLATVDGVREITVINRSFLDTLSGSIFDFVVPDRHHWFFPQNWETQGGLRWGFLDVPLDQGFAQDVPNYMGILVVVFFLASFLPRVNQLLVKEIRILRALAVFLFALSLRTLTFGSYAIPAPSAIFKFLFPGARVFSRFALLAEPIAIIIAIYVVFLLSRNLKAKVVKSVFSFGIICIMLLDFHPTNNREYLIEHEQFTEFNSIIASTGGGVLVLSDIADGAISGPTINGISETWKSIIISNSEKSSLAAYLASLGVSYVVTDKDANFSAGNTSLGAPERINFDLTRFPLIETLDYRGTRYELRGVEPRQGDVFCSDCLPWTLFVDYGFIDHASTQGGVSWVTERRLDLLISPVSYDTAKFRLRMTISPPFGGFAEARTLSIEVNGATESFVIKPPFTTVEIDFVKGDLIKIFDHNKCVIPSELEKDNPDSRCLLYGFNKIEVVSASR